MGDVGYGCWIKQFDNRLYDDADESEISSCETKILHSKPEILHTNQEIMQSKPKILHTKAKSLHSKPKILHTKAKMLTD